jgi:hypothetical protein
MNPNTVGKSNTRGITMKGPDYRDYEGLEGRHFKCGNLECPCNAGIETLHPDAIEPLGPSRKPELECNDIEEPEPNHPCCVTCENQDLRMPNSCKEDSRECLNSNFMHWTDIPDKYVQPGPEHEPRADTLVTNEYLARIATDTRGIEGLLLKTHLAIHNMAMAATNKVAADKRLIRLNKFACGLGIFLFTLHHVILRVF